MSTQTGTIEQEIVYNLTSSFTQQQHAFAEAAIKTLGVRLYKESLFFLTTQAGVCTINRVLLQSKLSKCTFLTRWYWRRKLYKTTLELRKNNQGIEYIKSIMG